VGSKWILCIFEVRKKPSGTPFSVFLSDGGAPHRCGARENSPLPPSQWACSYKSHSWSVNFLLFIICNVRDAPIISVFSCCINDWFTFIPSPPNLRHLVTTHTLIRAMLNHVVHYNYKWICVRIYVCNIVWVTHDI